MNFPNSIPVSLIAEKYECELRGNHKNIALGINVIHSVQPGDITFVDVEKYYQKAIHSQATIIIIDRETEVPSDKTLLIHSTPFAIYESIIKEYRIPVPEENIRETIDIHPSAKVHPTAIIREHVTIGANSIIHGNTFIDSYTNIGEHVIVEPGCVIGSDAFYYKKENGKYIKWTSAGMTIIEDYVEIGAGSTINKGVSSETIIGEGTKIDCQVHVGHGCKIGKHCLITAQVGIGGKTNIGDHSTIFGQVGIGQNITIGEDVIILGKSGVTKNLEKGKTYFGYPAAEVFQKNRELASLRQLPEIIRRIK